MLARTAMHLIGSIKRMMTTGRGFYTQKQDGFYLDMAGYNRQLLTKAGIPSRNIYTSPIDTAKDDKYFSHSKGDKSGRIAVIAQIK